MDSCVVIIESSIISDTPLKARSFRVTDILQTSTGGGDLTSGFAWIDKGSSYQNVEVPNYVNIEYDVNTQFIVQWDDNHIDYYRTIFYSDGTYAITADKMKYWDYSTADWSSAQSYYTVGLCNYLYNRFSSGRKEYTGWHTVY